MSPTKHDIEHADEDRTAVVRHLLARLFVKLSLNTFRPSVYETKRKTSKINIAIYFPCYLVGSADMRINNVSELLMDSMTYKAGH